MAVRYCTSKISTFQDIEKLTTFGFRGKILFIAVGSCSNCQSLHASQAKHLIPSMTLLKACRLPPKRSTTPLPRNINLIKVDRCKGSCHLLGSRMQWMNKLIYHSSTSEKPSAAISKSGTMVTVHNPFSNMPVRRQVTCNQHLLIHALQLIHSHFTLTGGTKRILCICKEGARIGHQIQYRISKCTFCSGSVIRFSIPQERACLDQTNDVHVARSCCLYLWYSTCFHVGTLYSCG